MRKSSLLPFCILMIILVSSSIFPDPGLNASSEPIAELVMPAYVGSVHRDLTLYIARALSMLNIQMYVHAMHWIEYIPPGIKLDYDLQLLRLTDIKGDPDLSHSYYFELAEGFNWKQDSAIPYVNESNDLLQQGSSTLNIVERKEAYYEFQDLFMDKILQYYPIAVTNKYSNTWATLQGYDQRWGIANCLPYMNFSTLHEGQQNTSTFVDYSYCNWGDFNPLFIKDTGSEKISSLIFEKLLALNPDDEPLKTGLIADWNFTSQNHLELKIRDNIFWNPSYNILGSNASTAIETLPLVTGMKGEFSNGTNKKVTAKDAVFSLLCYASPIISKRAGAYKWLKDIWIDENDPLIFHIDIDSNPSTPEQDIYAPIWSVLNIPVLPEFFLNSTDTSITHTLGGVDVSGIYENIEESSEWDFFMDSAFGCGKYMLLYGYSFTTSDLCLKASPYWHGIGVIDGNVQDLDFDTYIVRLFSETDSSIAEFLDGKIDIWETDDWQNDNSQMCDDPRFVTQSKKSDDMLVLYFNLQRPFVGASSNYEWVEAEGKTAYTKAVAVRKALCYALDKEDMNQEIFDGEYPIIDCPIHPSLDFYCKQDVNKYPYDFDLAVEWLEAAGYTLNLPTTTETTTSTPTTSTLTTSTSSTTNQTSSSSTNEIEALNIVVIFTFLLMVNVLKSGGKRKKIDNTY